MFLLDILISPFKAAFRKWGPTPVQQQARRLGRLLMQDGQPSTENKAPVSPGGHRKDSKNYRAMKSVMAAAHLHDPEDNISEHSLY